MGDRGQHRMQSDAERITKGRFGSGEFAVDPGLGVVESAARCQSQALGEAANSGFVGEADIGQLQPATTVDPDRIRCCDKHIGDLRIVQQRFEQPRPGHLGLQQP